MLIATAWGMLMTSASRFVDVSGALAIELTFGLIGYWGGVHLK